MFNDYTTKKPIGNPNCHLHHTYFEGKHTINMKQLERILVELVKKEDQQSKKDFVSLMILHLFSNFLFPTSSGQVNESFIPYLENLEKLHDYAWAFPVHETLMASLIQASKRLEQDGDCKVNFFGCSIAVNVRIHFHF